METLAYHKSSTKNLHESNCDIVSCSVKLSTAHQQLYYKRDSLAGAFLYIKRNFFRATFPSETSGQLLPLDPYLNL